MYWRHWSAKSHGVSLCVRDNNHSAIFSPAGDVGFYMDTNYQWFQIPHKGSSLPLQPAWLFKWKRQSAVWGRLCTTPASAATLQLFELSRLLSLLPLFGFLYPYTTWPIARARIWLFSTASVWSRIVWAFTVIQGEEVIGSWTVRLRRGLVELTTNFTFTRDSRDIIDLQLIGYFISCGTATVWAYPSQILTGFRKLLPLEAVTRGE